MNEMETDETIKSKSLKIIIILFFTGFTIFAMVASLTLGSVDISFSTIVHTLLGNVQTTDEMVIWNIRFPRNIVGALVGANLAVSGAILQAVMKNPLADPGIVGVSSGAGLAGVIMLAGIGGMILLFPVSIFWAVLFGFWLPGLAAMQTLFPVLRQEYGVEVRSIPRPTAPDKPLTTQEQKKRSRANWWYYNWGIVAVAAMVIVGVAYVAHGLLTTVDPDYTVAVVTAEALPDEAVQRLQTALADYAEDANGDGAVVVQVNNYTWSADAALTDMNGQMAGATQMNTDLANGENKIWILDDPEGFEQAYGALSEKLGADWQAKLIPWSSRPALSGLELGSYNTAADGSQTVDIQSRFAGYSVAVFDASDALWQALNS